MAMSGIGGERTRTTALRLAAGLAALALVATSCNLGTVSSDTSTSSDSSTAYSQSGGTATLSGKSFSSSSSDENAVMVSSSGAFVLNGKSTLSKTGDTKSEDNSNFYGVNAIVLAKGGSSITMDDCTLTSAADGANGAFAYGSDSAVTLTNCAISTTGDSSRGVDATYGGKISISNSTISTTGAHCAALATDRYDSTAPQVIASNVTGTTDGDGSPGIYSTGTFTVSDCTLTATGSEAAAIEGLNSITLTDTSITGAKKWGVIIYQSTSGDSAAGTGTFTMTGGSITNDSTGPMFVVCNTSAVISLDGVALTNSSDTLVRATKASSGDSNINSSWGTAGGTVTFTATDQTLTGAITVYDSDCTVSLSLDNSSEWTASGDSTLASLTDSDSTYSNIHAPSGVSIFVNGATASSYTSAIPLTTSASDSSTGGTLYIE